MAMRPATAEMTIEVAKSCVCSGWPSISAATVLPPREAMPMATSASSQIQPPLPRGPQIRRRPPSTISQALRPMHWL